MSVMQHTPAQAAFVRENESVFLAACEQASWVVFSDCKLCGLSDITRTEMVRRAALRGIGRDLKPLALSKYGAGDEAGALTDFPEMLDLEERAYAAAKEAVAKPQ